MNKKYVLGFIGTLGLSLLGLTTVPVSASQPVTNNIQTTRQQALIPPSRSAIIPSPSEVTQIKQQNLRLAQQQSNTIPTLLFYNNSTGEGATALLNSAGKYQYVGSISGFGRWTHITSANQGSLLFYNASTGEGATARLDSAGNYQYVGSISGFGRWTHIVGNSDGGILFYNASTGEGATARLDSAGNYQYVGYISGFARGWTHITGL